MGKVEEYKRKLEKFEAKRAEEAKQFDIDKVLEDSKGLKEAYVSELDCVIQYGNIVMRDLAEINKAKTDEERAIRILWKMLSKADEHITLEKVEQLPIKTATAILRAITGNPLRRTAKP